MSNHVPVKYNKKQMNVHWMNALVHIHDFNCGCDSPLECTILTITEQEKHLRFNNNQLKHLKKCLTGDTAATQEEEEGFGDGDLEELFSTDFGEKDDTTDTATG